MPHSSVLQGLAIAKPSAESGVPPSSEAAKPALAAPSSAAAAFLTSIGGRFSSGGTIQPEPEGMQKAPEALEPPAQVQQHHLVYHWDAFTHRVAHQTFSGSCWDALHYCKGSCSHIVAADCRHSHSKMSSNDYRDLGSALLQCPGIQASLTLCWTCCPGWASQAACPHQPGMAARAAAVQALQRAGPLQGEGRARQGRHAVQERHAGAARHRRGSCCRLPAWPPTLGGSPPAAWTSANSPGMP